VCMYGEKSKTADWHVHSMQFQPVIQLPSSHMQASTCYMFNQLRDMAQILGEIVHHLGQEIVRKFSLQEPQTVDRPHQVISVWVAKSVCNVGKGCSIIQFEQCSMFHGRLSKFLYV
jgi:hypothetical protein